MRQSGFTLAEVLIALALLGVVAAFTIPKVMQAMGNTQKISLIKESVAALNDIAYQAGLNNDIRPRYQAFLDGTDTVTNSTGFQSAIAQYFSEKLNAVKFCPTDAAAEGCWPGDPVLTTETQPYPNTKETPGFILPNGVYINDFETNNMWAPSGDSIYIDYNGPAGPNKIGEDQMGINIMWETKTVGTTTRPAGQSVCAILSSDYNAANQALCNQVFSN